MRSPRHHQRQLPYCRENALEAGSQGRVAAIQIQVQCLYHADAGTVLDEKGGHPAMLQDWMYLRLQHVPGPGQGTC